MSIKLPTPLCIKNRIKKVGKAGPIFWAKRRNPKLMTDYKIAHCAARAFLKTDIFSLTVLLILSSFSLV